MAPAGRKADWRELENAYLKDLVGVFELFATVVPVIASRDTA